MRFYSARSQRQQSLQIGVTLIELLVVMAIISILVGGTFAGYRTFERRQKVKQAALNLKNNLRLAQIKAISVDVPSACDIPQFVTVDFTSSTTYELLYDCDVDVPASLNEKYSIPPGVDFTVYSDIQFEILSGKPVTGQPYTLKLQNTEFTIDVSDSGVISCTGDEGGSPLKCL